MKNYNGKLKISIFNFQITLLNHRDLVKYNVTSFACKGERRHPSSTVGQKYLSRFAELFIAVIHEKITTTSENRSNKFELTLYKTNGSALFILQEMHQYVPSPRHFARCVSGTGLDWATCCGEAASFSY